MKYLYLLLCLTFSTNHLAAQPQNDDCKDAIDLGILPYCETTIYTNIDASTSNIGVDNIPACFNGGSVENDVWFKFTIPSDGNSKNFKITLTTGDSNGITNPQIAIYRGDCAENQLSDLGICASAEPNETDLVLEAIGLKTNTQYFLRVNDFSATATPNWGDFTLCIEDLATFFNIGETPSTGLCAGSLFDSGGSEGDYGILENHFFTICPTDFHRCIAIEVESYDIEAEFDQLTIFEGTPDNIGATLLTIDRIGQASLAYAKRNCITVQFTSDASQNRSGFKLNWQCLVEACPEIEPTTCDNPVPIAQIPFEATNLSTCFAGNTIEISPCGEDDFLSGSEYIFAYDSPGGECISVNINGVIPETGISILRGCPESGDAICINQKQAIGNQTSFNLANISLQEKGTYYFIIANEDNCTPFDISIINATTCPNVFPSATACENALVLNGCSPNIPAALTVELGSGSSDFFKFDVNNGCWEDIFETNYTWFTFEAQADGEFAFLLRNNDPDGLVDIDFNIWGPFNNLENACVASENTQPIRSSWADDLVYSVTGLANINPELGTPVTSTCEDAFGEGFVKPLQVKKGEVYVVLINDFDGVIFSGAIAIDFAGTTPGILTDIPNSIMATQDTFICVDNSIALTANGASAYEWSPTESLDCINCPSPVATPLSTTTYTLNASTVCSIVSKEVTVEVITANAGIDQSVCQGASIQLNSEISATNISYTWSSPTGINNLSCTDCPNPILTANDVGNFEYRLGIQKGDCVTSDTMQLMVMAGTAPIYSIADNQQLCLGDSLSLGGEMVAGQMYEWTTKTSELIATTANPTVSPAMTTTYFLKVTRTACSLPTLDSVTIEVNQLPIINIHEDTIICQATPILLSNTTIENGVIYEWTSNDLTTINNPNLANTMATPLNDVMYKLTATNGACQISDSLNIEVKPISVEFTNNKDLVNLCLGETLALNVAVTPTSNLPRIRTLEQTLDTNATNLVLQPITNQTYIASLDVNGCSAADTLTVKVDSLPKNMAILPADTTVCLGAQLILTSPIYDAQFYPNIQHRWSPNVGFDNPDSFYNLVITPTDTVMLHRINQNGACVDTSTTLIKVIPFIEIDIATITNLICEGETVDLSADVPTAATDLAWFPTEHVSCTDCPNTTVSPTQTTTYTLSGSWMNCPIMGSTEIAVTNFSNTTLVNLDTNVIFIGQPVDSIIIQTDLENITAVEWREDGQIIVGENDFILSYTPLANVPPSDEIRTVTIEAMLTTAEGCLVLLETIIIVQPPTVPNVFTPGNDGLNDYFNIALPDNADNITVFRVYNRWGNIMYDNEEPEKGWDGSKRNNRKDFMPSGVYVYLIQYQVGEKTETIKGNVTLIR
ncbi:MAG: gliding motility-associated C-terminal domain-containing protein [Saprospiraceae bacterium]